MEYANCQKFVNRLNLYKLRRDVNIKDFTDLYNVLYSYEPLERTEFSYPDPRYNRLGFRCLIKKENLEGAKEAVDGLYLADKYKYTIIDGYTDLIYEKSIPIEYGAEELNALDFKKGCYIGQEVISRAKYQGVIRKKIFKLSFESAIPSIESNSIITDLSDNKVGIVCSINKNEAIALLREEKYLGLAEKRVMVEHYLGNVTVPPWR
jgi:folate-binding protein YgfZ